MFAEALAIPSRWFGTVSTTTAVSEDTARANPIPIRTNGAMTGPRPTWEETGTVAVHRSPAAMRASPVPIVHRGL
jgi:hypothetical protein